ncbi:FtsB family cell division protein [Frondihabitans australicus]|uniref:Cell division protein FtsB n=1 Tax=Frondihabitans australicus TaxID=386892 RepID=A0A495IIT6_9MICO|nr:septum formation initiator family protein [Frondihabitans australicus]RKR75016.1 cell division protein FtsB [Frondihabitans australicus]
MSTAGERHTHEPASKGGASKNRRIPVSLPAMESAAGGWLRASRFSGFSLLMLVIIILFIVVLAPSLRTLIQQQQQVASLEQSVQKQKSDVQSLKGDVARWNDPAYIEAQARDRLLYVYPGEYSYLVMNPSKSSGTTTTTTSGTQISDKIQTPKVDWVQAMTSSVLDAGLTNEPATKLVSPDISGSESSTGTK